jgi:hypothetical protein
MWPKGKSYWRNDIPLGQVDLRNANVTLWGYFW